jgi:hypothetical protein
MFYHIQGVSQCSPWLQTFITITIVHSHRKTVFFLTTRYVRCVHHEWQGTHRHDIQVLATHASAWVNTWSLHTLASPSGRNENYDEKQLTGGGGGVELSCSFYLYRLRKYVSYGFLIINVCNPGVHYETPCIIHREVSVASAATIRVSYKNTNNTEVCSIFVH